LEYVACDLSFLFIHAGSSFAVRYVAENHVVGHEGVHPSLVATGVEKAQD
jgi:hypothetical protein